MALISSHLNQRRLDCRSLSAQALLIFESFLTFVYLLSFLIPSSLYVTVELQKLIGAKVCSDY